MSGKALGQNLRITLGTRKDFALVMMQLTYCGTQSQPDHPIFAAVLDNANETPSRAREAKNLRVDFPKNDIEEACNHISPLIRAPEVVTLEDVVLIEENFGWNGSTKQDIPLRTSTISVRHDQMMDNAHVSTWTYCRYLTDIRVLDDSPENGTAGNKKVARDEWEARGPVTLIQTRSRRDSRTQKPLSIRNAGLGDIGVVKQRGAQGTIECFVDTNFLI